MHKSERSYFSDSETRMIVKCRDFKKDRYKRLQSVCNILFVLQVIIILICLFILKSKDILIISQFALLILFFWVLFRYSKTERKLIQLVVKLSENIELDNTTPINTDKKPHTD